MKFSADAEILFPTTQSFASGRRVRGVQSNPICIIAGGVTFPNIQAVKVGEIWFVRGDSAEARTLDRLTEGAKL